MRHTSVQADSRWSYSCLSKRLVSSQRGWATKPRCARKTSGGREGGGTGATHVTLSISITFTVVRSVHGNIHQIMVCWNLDHATEGPIISTTLSTSLILSRLIDMLNMQFRPRTCAFVHHRQRRNTQTTNFLDLPRVPCSGR